MNEDFKAKWVAALRSGAYKQGRKFLRTGDQFCCLGVACDVLAKEGKGKWLDEGDSYEHAKFIGNYGNIEDASRLTLPQFVQRAIGLDASDPRVHYQGQGLSLASLNDGQKPFDDDLVSEPGRDPLSFNEIADLIEEQL